MPWATAGEDNSDQLDIAPTSPLMTSCWIRFAGMDRAVVMVPGPVKAPVMVTESGELENRALPTVVGVPRPNDSAAEAECAAATRTIPARILRRALACAMRK